MVLGYSLGRTVFDDQSHSFGLVLSFLILKTQYTARQKNMR